MVGPSPKSSLVSCLGYTDADAAVDWLCRAFGFSEHAVHRNEAGNVVHAELTFGNGMIMLGPDKGGEFGKLVMTMPERAGGRCTQTIYVIVPDVDAHFARASAAGAEIIIAPRGESYGGRSYSARDPEGMRGVSAATIPGLLLRKVKRLLYRIIFASHFWPGFD